MKSIEIKLNITYNDDGKGFSVNHEVDKDACVWEVLSALNNTASIIEQKLHEKMKQEVEQKKVKWSDGKVEAYVSERITQLLIIDLL